MSAEESTKAMGAGQPRGESRRGIARAAGILGGLTLASRIAGLARDMVVGAVFGASTTADAFFVAFRIPNLFRRIVAEGAASSAFVPVFTAEMVRGGPTAACEAARAVGIVAALCLTIIVAAGVLFSDWVVAIFAPGFAAEPGKYTLTVELTRSTFPYLLFVGLAAWAMGVLHTFRRFVAPALGPVLLNVAIITAVLGCAHRLQQPVHALVYGVLLGGVLQFAAQLPSLRAVGVSWRSARGAFTHPALGRVRRLLLPTLLGGAVYQVNILVATIFASLLPGPSVSYLWYADRVFEFPLGIVAVAIGTAALPTLSGQAASHRYDDMTHSVAYSLKLVFALCFPATVGLWMLAPQIVAVLFERGQFTPADTAMTAWALRAYTAGLVAVAAIRVLVSVFYALEKPRVPVRIAIFAFAVNVIADIALMGPTDPSADWWGAGAVAAAGDWLRIADLRHAGLALGTGIAATANASLLFVFAVRRLPGLLSQGIGRSVGVHGLACFVMAVGLSCWTATAAWVAEPLRLAWIVAGGIPVGCVIYIFAATRLGSEELSEMLQMLVSRLRRLKAGS